MPHQCVRCNKLYDDGSKEILSGCSCGGRFFFYIKKESLQEAKKITNKISKLSMNEKEQIEEDVLDILGDQIEDDKPVILDIETIKVLQPGKYELDLVDLFKGKPLVFKLEDGKYFIDIASTFTAKDLEAEEEKLEKNKKDDDEDDDEDNDDDDEEE